MLYKLHGTDCRHLLALHNTTQCLERRDGAPQLVLDETPEIFHTPLLQVIPDHFLKVAVNDQQVADGEARVRREVRPTEGDEESVPALSVSAEGEQYPTISELKPGVRSFAIARQLPASPFVGIILGRQLP